MSLESLVEDLVLRFAEELAGKAIVEMRKPPAVPMALDVEIKPADPGAARVHIFVDEFIGFSAGARGRVEFARCRTPDREAECIETLERWTRAVVEGRSEERKLVLPRVGHFESEGFILEDRKRTRITGPLFATFFRMISRSEWVRYGPYAASKVDW